LAQALPGVVPADPMLRHGNERRGFLRLLAAGLALYVAAWRVDKQMMFLTAPQHGCDSVVNSLPLGRLRQPPPSASMKLETASMSRPRGSSLVPLILSMALALAFSFSRPAYAETAYQLKLPEGWQVEKSIRAPRADPRPQALLVARDTKKQGEVKVVRVPLVATQQDPQGLGPLATTDYFYTPDTQVTQKQLVDLLQAGYKAQPAIFSYKDLDAEDFKRNNRKYLRYDFESARCEGIQVEASKGKLCQKPDSDEPLPAIVRHHRLINTVYPEADLAQPGEGNTDESFLPQVLWILDISVPLDMWEKEPGIVRSLADTFAVGQPAELEKLRPSGAQVAQ